MAIPLDVGVNIQNSNLGQSQLPDNSGFDPLAPQKFALQDFVAKADAHNKAAQTMESIRKAKADHEQQSALLDIERRKADISMEEAQAKGQLTNAQARILQAITDEKLGAQEDVHAAKGTLIQNAEDQATTQQKQLEQVLQNHPVTQAIAGGMISPAMAVAPQQPINPAQYAMAQQPNVPTIPAGGQMIQPDRVTVMKKLQGLQDAGYDVSGMLKGSGIELPKQPTEEQKLARDTKKQEWETSRQDKLEKIAGDRLEKIKSARSGGVGLQDAKVNSAIHARELINQSYDQKTGNFDVTQVPYSELAESLANLLGAGAQTSETRVAQLKQRTASGDLNAAWTWATGKPSNAAPQDVLKQLVGMIDRQGQVSEKLRDKYIQDSKDIFPAGLNAEARERLLAMNVGNSFSDTLKNSPDQAGSGSAPNGRVTVISPNGQLGHIPASQLQAALAQGYRRQ